MIRVAIVEDELDYQNRLRQYIHKYEKERGEKLDVRLFSDGDEILYEYAGDYQIILLDIQMKHLNGMTTAQKIRKLDAEVIIIFITNMAQYAIQGYRVNALSYILKPISYFAFAQELDKAVLHIKKQNSHYIMIQQEHGMKRVNVREITFIESQNHNVVVHMKDDTYSFRGRMKDMEEKLEMDHFFRCNNGYLVNMEYVESLQQNSVTVNGEELQISRARKKTFVEALTNYFGGRK